MANTVGRTTDQYPKKPEVCQLLLNQKLIGLRFFCYLTLNFGFPLGCVSHLPTLKLCQHEQFRLPLVIGTCNESVKFIASFAAVHSLVQGAGYGYLAFSMTALLA